MFSEVYCLRKPDPEYDRLLVINNVKMLFDSTETARHFAREHHPEYYVDKDMAWSWQRVLSLEDIGGDWEPAQVSWFGG